MTSEPETKDLLVAFAQEREAASRRRRRVGWGVLVALMILAAGEPFVTGSIWVIGGACLALVFGIFLALALGYCACVFMAAWTYAHTVQDQGQTRPSVTQTLTLLFLCSFGALPIAAFAIQETVDFRFWVTLAVITWNNVCCGMLGYGLAFWTRLRPRAPIPTLPIED